MRPEDWQAYQAGRTGGSPPGGGAPPQPSQAYMNAPLPRPPRRGLNWPMAFLILGLAVIGGCFYSVGYMVESIGPSMSASAASEPSVGVLVIEEEIMGSIWATDIIHRFANDPNIRSVVVRINSPGGSVAPCQEIYKSLKTLDKPIVISMGSVAASGGLYIAAAGDVIMANPGTITGSIGVIMQSIEVTGTMEKIGLKSEVIKSGEYKDMGSPFRPLRENERDLLQRMIMEVYEQFVADLSAGRPAMNAAEVRRLADGRIYSGSDAQRLGLVDELGGFEDALMRAARMGGLPANQRPELVIEDGRRPWWETVMQSQSSLNLTVPPSLTPGFSMKYLYQPDMGGSSH